MKKISLLMFLILLQSKTFSQSYIPFPNDSTEFQCSGYAVDGSCGVCVFNFSYCLGGDTIINGLNYTYLHASTPSPQCMCGGIIVFEGAIRQNITQQKVYIVLKDSTNEKVLYDFTQQPGDTLNSALVDISNQLFGPTVFTIDSIDSVQINSVYHKRINVHDQLFLMYPIKIIEGVGSNYGPVVPFWGFERASTLYCIQRVNQNLYLDSLYGSCATVTCSYALSVKSNNTPTNKIVLSPNPSSHKINLTNIPVGEGKVKLEIISVISGKRFSFISEHKPSQTIDISSLPSGFYLCRILNHEKVVYSGKFIIE